jgi:hypothetical protein
MFWLSLARTITAVISCMCFDQCSNVITFVVKSDIQPHPCTRCEPSTACARSRTRARSATSCGATRRTWRRGRCRRVARGGSSAGESPRSSTKSTAGRCFYESPAPLRRPPVYNTSIEPQVCDWHTKTSCYSYRATETTLNIIRRLALYNNHLNKPQVRNELELLLTRRPCFTGWSSSAARTSWCRRGSSTCSPRRAWWGGCTS